MNDKSSIIPGGKLINDLDFSLFYKTGNEENIPNHEVVFISHDYFIHETSFPAREKKSIVLKELNYYDSDKYIMVIKLAGKFYSTDDFELRIITAGKSGISLLIDYSWVEDQDGVPFYITPLLMIPMNSSIIKYNSLNIIFETGKRDFSTGKKLEDLTKKITDFNFSFDA